MLAYSIWEMAERGEWDAVHIAIDVAGLVGFGALGAVGRALAVSEWSLVPQFLTKFYAGAAVGMAVDVAHQFHDIAEGRQERFDRDRMVWSGMWSGIGTIGFVKTCFAADTPMRTEWGSVRADAVAVGTRLLSRDENDPAGAVEPRVVEEVFVREGLITLLTVMGRTIRSTAEHPFWVEGKGWMPLNRIKEGDRIWTEAGGWVRVDGVEETGEWETVYNFRVAEYHTYFVGCDEWGFSLWAHNVCKNPWNEFQKGTHGTFNRTTNKATNAYNGTSTFTSPEGLVYGSGSKQGSRIKHVLAHGRADSTKKVHTVFDVDDGKLMATIDEAWKARGAAVPGDPGKFIVDLKRPIGTNGETHVTIIVRSGTSEIITAFPS